MAGWGKIRREGERFFLDFRPHGRIYSNHGVPLTDRLTAQNLLDRIRDRVADGEARGVVLASYESPKGRQSQLLAWAERWLRAKRELAQRGRIAEHSYKGMEAGVRRHWVWWKGQSIHALSEGVIEEWTLWLEGKGLRTSSVRKESAYLKSMLRWVERQGQLMKVPPFPTIRVDETAGLMLSPEQQRKAQEAIPEPLRGLFLALADLGLRVNEARAALRSDYRDGWLTVQRACKGPSGAAPIRGTKTRTVRRVPVSEDLAAWIANFRPPECALRGELLFPGPRGRVWAHSTLTDYWRRALREANLPHVPLNRGGRHSMATEALRRGVPLELIRRFLGHTSDRTTRRYAKLADQALVEVLRKR